MNGRDLKTIAHEGCYSDTLMLFEDADGQLHEIATCIMTRGEYKDYYGSLVILRENPVNDFMLRVIPAPPDIQAALDRYNMKED